MKINETVSGTIYLYATHMRLFNIGSTISKSCIFLFQVRHYPCPQKQFFRPVKYQYLFVKFDWPSVGDLLSNSNLVTTFCCHMFKILPLIFPFITVKFPWKSPHPTFTPPPLLPVIFDWAVQKTDEQKQQQGLSIKIVQQFLPKMRIFMQNRMNQKS